MGLGIFGRVLIVCAIGIVLQVLFVPTRPTRPAGPTAHVKPARGETKNTGAGRGRRGEVAKRVEGDDDAEGEPEPQPGSRQEPRPCPPTPPTHCEDCHTIQQRAKDPLVQVGAAGFSLASQSSALAALESYAAFHKSQVQKWRSGSCKEVRALVMIPDEGLGNRFRVMVSLFLLAMLTERVFLVDWTTPFPLSDILEAPLGIDWSASPPKGCKPVFYDFSYNKLNGKMERMNRANLNADYPEVLISMMTTTPFYGYLSSHTKWGPIIRRVFGHSGVPSLLQHLVLPSWRVREAMAPVLEKIGNGELISVHLRTGQIEKGRGKGKTYMLPKSLEFFRDCILTTFRLRTAQKRNPFLFVASDDPKVAEQFSSVPQERMVKLTRGEVAHITHTTGHSLDDYVRAAADFFLLGEGDVRFGTGGSSFSAMAFKRKPGGATFLFPTDHTDPYQIMLTIKVNELASAIPEWCTLPMLYPNSRLPAALKSDAKG